MLEEEGGKGCFACVVGTGNPKPCSTHWLQDACARSEIAERFVTFRDSYASKLERV